MKFNAQIMISGQDGHIVLQSYFIDSIVSVSRDTYINTNKANKYHVWPIPACFPFAIGTAQYKITQLFPMRFCRHNTLKTLSLSEMQTYTWICVCIL